MGFACCSLVAAWFNSPMQAVEPRNPPSRSKSEIGEKPCSRTPRQSTLPHSFTVSVAGPRRAIKVKDDAPSIGLSKAFSIDPPENPVLLSG
jgi:hypothetical protein